MRNDNGLLVEDLPGGEAQAVGYLLSFAGHGVYSPNGKIGNLEEDEINRHNDLLSQAELRALKARGRGMLYFTGSHVTNFTGSLRLEPTKISRSWHNFAGRNGRADVWFRFNSSRWHGVNIGDNQMLRVRRTKERY